MLQRVLLRAVDGVVIVAALAGIHKLQVDVVADALDVAVVPHLEREGRRLAAALVHRPLILAAAGVGIDVVRLAVCNVDVAAVRHPSRLARSEVLVRIRDAGVDLVAILVVRRVGARVAPLPEVLDELVPLLIVREMLERLRLGVGNDPPHILLQPGLVDAVQLVLQVLLLLDPLPVAQPALQRVRLLHRRQASGSPHPERSSHCLRPRNAPPCHHRKQHRAQNQPTRYSHRLHTSCFANFNRVCLLAGRWPPAGCRNRRNQRRNPCPIVVRPLARYKPMTPRPALISSYKSETPR